RTSTSSASWTPLARSSRASPERSRARGMERLPGVPSGGGAPPGAGGRLRPIVFTGSGGEYFRIWIVNLLLSILSLGIYSAWAKVRRQRYFHRNTRLAGSAFDYHARPAAILLGRIVAAAGLVV